MAKSKNTKGILLLLALVGVWFYMKRNTRPGGGGTSPMFRTGGGDEVPETEQAPEQLDEFNSQSIRPRDNDFFESAASAEAEITELDFFDNSEDEFDSIDFDIM